LADYTSLAVIVIVFGTILAVALYFFLFKISSGNKASSTPISLSANPAEEAIRKEAITKLGEEVLQVMREANEIKRKVNDLDDYVEKVVELWKKKKLEQISSKKE
jgi:hypothetical protein